MLADDSPINRTTQAAVHIAGLDSHDHRRLRGGVGRPRGKRTASRLFQKIWAPVEAAQSANGIDPGTIAAKCGFGRSVWFTYGNKGTIPFHLLERVLAYLNLRLEAQTLPVVSGVPATPPESQEATTVDYGRRMARLFEDVPEEQLEAAFGAAFTAARTAIRELPFVEPSAEQKRASRGRSSKS